MVFSVDITYSDVERIEDEARMQELYDLFLLMDEEDESNIDNTSKQMTSLRVLRALDAVTALERVVRAIVTKVSVKAELQLITQSINLQKLDETERTKQIRNRLKREAKIFQLIKYSNHLISIFPKLQTTNYIEA
ncbi:hypothetical protein [Acinetobacter sp. ANC 3791]|uniref:hypothetical protein n=1 Tax=Acinetobacter sp. ANC 3791 TaxID=2529836 RepID=UPI00103DF6DA|nr:hypothetical protein [Acinetobacter sp. ANC 3791]TCB83106.1 hypothetical protein E0H90_12385 [Acinetobacter sp. ANC 3791]